MRRPSLTIALFIAIAGSSVAQDRWLGSGTNPVPAGARVTLEVDRPEFLLGENVLIHFVLENTGDDTIAAGFGGDYRGATRHLRFSVTATDESGQVAEDPDPSQMCMGGLGGDVKLKPGEKYVQSLPLVRYCQILKPGRYTIRVAHDFGWKEGERKRPVGEVAIRFRMPNPKEAEHVIVEMEKLPTDPNRTWNKRTEPYQDFTCLRMPVYLKPLLTRVRNGNSEALRGLASIPTPEATAALIELGGDADRKLAMDAATALSVRLPDPEFEGKLPGRGPFRLDGRETRRLLAAKSWDPKFAPQVRSLATNFVSHVDTADISLGAFLLQAAGKPADAPVIFSAIGRVLDGLVKPRREPKDNILDPPRPLPELLRAMEVLRLQGFTLDESSMNEAQFFVYFTWLAGQPPPRSERWYQMAEAFGPNSRFPVREAIVRSIPQPLPEPCVEWVKGRLSDSDLGVCRAACTVAGESGRKEFLKPILEIIATEHQEWLLREANIAATKLGADIELLDIWASRLEEEQLFSIGLDVLTTVMEGLPGSWGGRTDLSRGERIELSQQWQSFIAKHRDELRAGKKFKIGDPSLTPELFGRARAWNLPDGKTWPEQKRDE